MPDDSELDYLKTFLAAVVTTAAVKSISDVRDINAQAFGDTTRILIHAGNLTGCNPDGYQYSKAYIVHITEATEALLIATFINIITGVRKLNRRQTITGYTKPNQLLFIKIVPNRIDREVGTTKRWYMSIILDVEWSL